MAWRRRSYLILAGAAGVGLILAAFANARDVVIFNHSPSIPTGFYVRTDTPIAVGAFVTVRARDVAAGEAQRRRFEDATDRFIKRVAAVGGARICAAGRRLIVNGGAIIAVVADIRTNDDAGSGGAAPAGDDDDRQGLTGWQGCRTLAEDEILLLGDSEDSFDGRYWGPTNISLVEGVWRKL